MRAYWLSYREKSIEDITSMKDVVLLHSLFYTLWIDFAINMHLRIYVLFEILL